MISLIWKTTEIFEHHKIYIFFFFYLTEETSARTVFNRSVTFMSTIDFYDMNIALRRI